MNKAELKNTLQNNIANVIFEKTDGTLREMRCTLQPGLLPVQEIKEDKKERPENDTILAVWDLDNEGWRSFRIESIRSVVLV